MLPNDGTYDIMLSKDRINSYVRSHPILIQKCVGLKFAVSNPNYRESDRKEALVSLINELGEIANAQGYKVAYSNLKSASLINHFTDFQHIKGSFQTTEMIKIL